MGETLSASFPNPNHLTKYSRCKRHFERLKIEDTKPLLSLSGKIPEAKLEWDLIPSGFIGDIILQHTSCHNYSSICKYFFLEAYDMYFILQEKFILSIVNNYLKQFFTFILSTYLLQNNLIMYFIYKQSLLAFFKM